MNLGYSVASAGGADQAFQMCVKDPPDLVIADWQLGTQADGLDACELLLGLNSRLYIIMLTGASRESLVQKSFGIPIKQVLAKPIRQDELEKSLNRALCKIQGVK